MNLCNSVYNNVHLSTLKDEHNHSFLNCPVTTMNHGSKQTVTIMPHEPSIISIENHVLSPNPEKLLLPFIMVSNKAEK